MNRGKEISEALVLLLGLFFHFPERGSERCAGAKRERGIVVRVCVRLRGSRGLNTESQVDIELQGGEKWREERVGGVRQEA